jgi:hypothetical protein
MLARSTNNLCVLFMVADPIRFGTKFLLMLFCGFPRQQIHRRSAQSATDSLTFLVAKFPDLFLGSAETRQEEIVCTR